MIGRSSRASTCSRKQQAQSKGAAGRKIMTGLCGEMAYGMGYVSYGSVVRAEEE
jgi:hypothetical protein